MDPSKLKVVMDCQPPKSLDELRAALGLLGHYCQYVRNYADIAEPLIAMTREVQDKYHLKRGKPRGKVRHHKNKPNVKPWQWGDEEQQAFNTIKALLAAAPVLAHPDSRGNTLFAWKLMPPPLVRVPY